MQTKSAERQLVETYAPANSWITPLLDSIIAQAEADGFFDDIIEETVESYGDQVENPPVVEDVEIRDGVKYGPCQYCGRYHVRLS